MEDGAEIRRLHRAEGVPIKGIALEPHTIAYGRSNPAELLRMLAGEAAQA